MNKYHIVNTVIIHEDTVIISYIISLNIGAQFLIPPPLFLYPISSIPPIPVPFPLPSLSISPINPSTSPPSPIHCPPHFSCPSCSLSLSSFPFPSSHPLALPGSFPSHFPPLPIYPLLPKADFFSTHSQTLVVSWWWKSL